MGAKHFPCVAWVCRLGQAGKLNTPVSFALPCCLDGVERCGGAGAQPAGSSHRVRGRKTEASTDLRIMPAARAHQLGRDGEVDQTKQGGSAWEVEAGGGQSLAVLEARSFGGTGLKLASVAEVPHTCLGFPVWIGSCCLDFFWLGDISKSGPAMAVAGPAYPAWCWPPPASHLPSDLRRAPGGRVSWVTAIVQRKKSWARSHPVLLPAPAGS